MALGALKPRVFSTGSAQTMSFHGWERSNHEFSRLGALKPCIFAAGSAQTMSFLDWQRSQHVFSRLGALRTRVWPPTTAFWMVAKNPLRNHRFASSFEDFWLFWLQLPLGTPPARDFSYVLRPGILRSRFCMFGALRPRFFSTGSAQTTIFLGWERSNEFSRLGALKPCIFSAGSA